MKEKTIIYYRDKRAHNRYHYRFQWSAYLMLLPAFVFVTIFVVAPLVMAVARSFFDYATGVYNFPYNFRYILQQALFTRAFFNVFWMSIVLIVIMILTSFFYANCLNTLDNGLSRVARVVIFMPFFISGVVSGVMYSMIFNYRAGIITSILFLMDKDPIAFATHQQLCYILIFIPSWWGGFGYQTLMMFAGIINIPKEYYEAASIDGANGFRKMFNITIPNMRNYFVLILVNLVTGYLQMFEIPQMMTGGGPLNLTHTPVLYLYNNFTSTGRPMNATIAGALLIMVIVTVANIFVFKVFKSEKSMDS